MANKLPLFTSAPRLELYFGGQKVAYAVGFSIRVSVDLTPVRTFGKYGLASIEPTMYNPVTGTLQIMKLASPKYRSESLVAAKLLNSGLTASSSQSASVDANGNATFTNEPNAINNTLDEGNWTSQKQIMAQLNPGTILVSQTFDAVLWMKVPIITSAGLPNNSSYDKNMITESAVSESNQWLKLVDIRIGSRNTNISLGRIVNQPVSFQALLATPIVKDKDNVDTDAFNLDTGMGQKQ